MNDTLLTRGASLAIQMLRYSLCMCVQERISSIRHEIVMNMDIENICNFLQLFAVRCGLFTITNKVFRIGTGPSCERITSFYFVLFVILVPTLNLKGFVASTGGVISFLAILIHRMFGHRYEMSPMFLHGRNSYWHFW